ncbi:hypothetical protein G3570_06035 [Balneolaceae bacterium YR4-1]|uniref:Uncharacterized protein n=1 Tax=Halalkalibaculum roseum TaxID=2709311 RepID=A0A6M1STN6_9BACT|nr:hypothetical protein [Halalkalibaculum roseum]NGP76182.1 hypothetical protein [Halalkalibaculum roseum]
MDNTKSIYDNDVYEQAGLTLRLDYMVEDFMELIQKEESENLVSEES